MAAPKNNRKPKPPPPAPPLVGAHMSVAGGVWRAFSRALEFRANCMQVFIKSNVQWRFTPPSDEDVEKFRATREETGIDAVVAHACYLVNLATPDETIYRKSLDDVKNELACAGRYGIRWLVFHPGNHMGSGIKRALARVAAALKETIASDGTKAGILVETTAGSGSAVGSTFEEIAEIMDLAGGGERLAMCLDTAHIFAAGYDISTRQGYAEMKRRLHALDLTSRVKVIHVNDSKAPLGSHVDRHEQIGKGEIGRTGFGLLMRDADFADVPKILETPKGACGKRPCDTVNIALLRRLAKAPSS